MTADSDRAGALMGALARFLSARRRDLAWVALLLVGVAFALRVIGLDTQSLWRDEVDAIRFASAPLADLLATFVAPGQNGPLYYVLLRPWLELAGTSEFALRFFSVAAGMVAVALVYQLARRLFPGHRWAHIVALLLAAASPYLVWYAGEGKMYSLFLCLALLSTVCYVAALARGGWARWLAYVAVTAATFYVHLAGVLLLPAHALAFLLVGRRVRRARWRGWLASMAGLALPYLPLLVWQWPMLREPATTGYPFVPLDNMVLSLVTSYSLGVIPPVSPWWLLPFAALLMAAAIWAAGRVVPWTSIGLLVTWLAVPVIVFFAITLVRPIYTARYLILILPAYLFLLVAGLTGVARRSRLLAAVLLLALLAANVRGLWLQAVTPLKSDFRAATRFVTQRLEPGDLVLFQIPYGRHPFEYYQDRLLAAPGGRPLGYERRIFLPLVAGGTTAPWWADGLYTNAGMTPAEVDRQMADLVAGRRTVWFVASEVALWDERGLVGTWLDEHAQRTLEAVWTRVSVRRYEFP